MKTIIITLLVVAGGAFILYTHSGRTDKYGGHHNRKTGEYHYHNRGYAPDPYNPYQNHPKQEKKEFRK